MSRVVIADLGNTTGPSRKKTSIRKKRICSSDGEVRRNIILDLTSATFDDDLTYIFERFERSVTKARRENKKLPGSANG
jgi:hypothetical protein